MPGIAQCPFTTCENNVLHCRIEIDQRLWTVSYRAQSRIRPRFSRTEHFNSLHQMFMDQYTEQWNALDTIAERIRALGHPAPGTYSEFARLASIKEVGGVPKAMDMVRHLVAAQEATARTARGLFPVVEAAGDQPTADLLTQRLEVHEKTAWMLRSILED